MSLHEAIAALDRSNPGLGVYLSTRSPKGILVCASSGSGTLTCSAGGFQMHSRFDPLVEARKAVASIGNDRDAVVIVGSGLGYALEAFAESRPGLFLIVAEVDSGLFLDCLSVDGVAGRIMKAGAVVVPDADGPSVSEALRAIGSSAPALIVNPAYRALFPEACASVEAGFAAYADEKSMNERTLRRFGMLWTRNIIRNARWMDLASGVADARSIARGLPALVVAAGPSLDTLLPSIAELAERFVIVCVDTAARSLARNGVAPDFIVVADPQYWNARHLDGLDCSRSTLVAECAVHPDVFKRDYAGMLLFSSRYPLGQRLEAARGSPLGVLGAGGSVATSAWDFARLLTPTRVVLTGLDLSYPGHRSHTKGSYFEERAREASTRLIPHEQRAWVGMHSAGASYQRSSDGGLVLSDKRLGLYAAWFAARGGKPGLQRVSGGAVSIAGFEEIDSESLLDYPVIASEKAAAIASLPKATPRHGVMSALRAVAAEIATLRSLAAEGLAAADARDFDRLSRIDQSILSMDARIVLSFVLPGLGAGVGKAIDLKGSAEEAKAIYRGLEEAARLVGDWIAREL